MPGGSDKYPGTKDFIVNFPDRCPCCGAPPDVDCDCEFEEVTAPTGVVAPDGAQEYQTNTICTKHG